ncbi:MAG: 4Fe-4S binding protein [Candidatus Helarchaeota archaeon]|nr:4Fe-4S binding protein [Candidatus Helarchaeota archaeon]
MGQESKTKEEQVYEELRKTMNEAPFRAPKSPSVMKVLKLFFPTVEMAEIGKYLECPWIGGKFKTAKMIAKESGKDLEKVKAILDQLFIRGGILRLKIPGGKKRSDVKIYFHVGTWGMSDILGTIGKDDTTDPAGLTYREVINKYYEEGYLMEWGPSKYPAFRTLMVDEPIDVEAKVLPYELASSIIKANKTVAIGYCNCRVRHRNCDHKIDCCILLSFFADMCVQLSKETPGARSINYVSQEKALEVLEECFKEGLVASTLNNASPTEAFFICMCCPCCCHVLGGYTKNITGWGNFYQTMKSNFQPRRDEAKCRKCNTCVKMCPVNAMWRHWPHKSDLSDDFIYHDENRCLGCGICAFNCPHDALTMVKVRDFTPEPNLPTQFKRVHKEGMH